MNLGSGWILRCSQSGWEDRIFEALCDSLFSQQFLTSPRAQKVKGEAFKIVFNCTKPTSPNRSFCKQASSSQACAAHFERMESPKPLGWWPNSKAAGPRSDLAALDPVSALVALGLLQG